MSFKVANKHCSVKYIIPRNPGRVFLFPEATLIRLATSNDVPALLVLARRMYEESQFTAWCGFSEDSVTRHIDRLFKDADSTFLVDERDGRIAGFITGHVRPVFFDHNTIQGIEDNWYVAPAYRRTSSGIRLLQVFLGWAKQSGAVSMLLSDRAFIESRNVARIMEKFGFTVDGISYRRVL